MAILPDCACVGCDDDKVDVGVLVVLTETDRDRGLIDLKC